MLTGKEKDYSQILNELFLAIREYFSRFGKMTFDMPDNSTPRIKITDFLFDPFLNYNYNTVNVSIVGDTGKRYPIFDFRVYNNGVVKFVKNFGKYKDLYSYVMNECLERLVADIKSETDRCLRVKHDKEIEEICKRRKEEQSLILAMKTRINDKENTKISKSDFYQLAKNSLHYLTSCVIKGEKPSHLSPETLSQMLVVLYDKRDISLTEMQSFQTAFELENLD